MRKFFSIKPIVGDHRFRLAVILAAAFILRLRLALLFKSLTFDEIESVAVASKPLGQIWPYLRWEMSPPLHFYFLHFWLAAFGQTEIAIRFSSIIASVLAVAALYLLGREVFASQRAGLVAAFFYALSPLFCFHGAWARMYSVFFLFSSLSFLFFLKLIKARGKTSISFAIFYAFFTLAALYTHLTGGLVILAELVYLLYIILRKTIRWREVIRKFIAPFVFLLLAYGPWLVYFLSGRFSQLGDKAWYASSQGNGSITEFFIYDVLRFLTPLDSFSSVLLAFSIIMILGFFAFFALKKGGRFGYRAKGLFTSGHFFSLVIIFVSFAGLFAAKLFTLRYAVVPAIGFFLILGRGFSAANRSIKIITALFLFLLVGISFNVFSSSRFTGDWKEVAGFISRNEQPGDKIVCSLNYQFLPLERYYFGQLEGTAPLNDEYKKGDRLATIIYSNIYPTTDESNIGQIDGFLTGAKRVFLIESSGIFPASGVISERHLLDRGFRDTGQRSDSGDNSAQVHLFERSAAR